MTIHQFSRFCAKLSVWSAVSARRLAELAPNFSAEAHEDEFSDNLCALERWMVAASPKDRQAMAELLALAAVQGFATLRMAVKPTDGGIH